MHFIPFPPDLTDAIASRIGAAYQVQRASKRPAASRIEKDWPAYRLADGTVRIAYDLYRPAYPEGSEPGLADCRLEHRFYPNETEGYEHFPFNFRPLVTA